MPRKAGSIGPLINEDGTVAVSKRKCPTLHRCLTRMVERKEQEAKKGWGRVAELRAAGQIDSACRVARKLLGVQGPPMSEEKKEELRIYHEKHKLEISERNKQKRFVRRRTLEVLKAPRRKTKVRRRR